MQPVRVWIFLSERLDLNRAASSAARESAQVKTGVIGRNFRFKPSNPCQKEEAPRAETGSFLMEENLS